MSGSLFYNTLCHVEVSSKVRNMQLAYARLLLRFLPFVHRPDVLYRLARLFASCSGNVSLIMELQRALGFCLAI
jgi:hypothetical protein